MHRGMSLEKQPPLGQRKASQDEESGIMANTHVACNAPRAEERKTLSANNRRMSVTKQTPQNKTKQTKQTSPPQTSCVQANRERHPQAKARTRTII
mmetsp:Transcript_8811/g.25366  ORF Transcript_8811/g.25366 Transcript_8811/m.25366 type:complete len:96 (-) Transcript_8811:37-324(-)